MMANVSKKRLITKSTAEASPEAEPRSLKSKPAGNGTGIRSLSNQVSPYVDGNVTQIRELQKKKQLSPPVKSFDEGRSKKSTAMVSQRKLSDAGGITPVDQSVGESSRSRGAAAGKSGSRAAESTGIGGGGAGGKGVPVKKKKRKSISVKPRRAEVETATQNGSDVISKAEVGKRSPGKKRKTSNGKENVDVEQVVDLEQTIPSKVSRSVTEPENEPHSVPQKKRDSVDESSDSDGEPVENEEDKDSVVGGADEDGKRDIDRQTGEEVSDVVEHHPVVLEDVVYQSLIGDEIALSGDPDVDAPTLEEQAGGRRTKALPRIRLSEEDERLDGDGAAEEGEDEEGDGEVESGEESDAETRNEVGADAKRSAADHQEANSIPLQLELDEDEDVAAESEAEESVEIPHEDNALSHITEEESRSERQPDSGRIGRAFYSDPKKSSPQSDEVAESTEQSEGKLETIDPQKSQMEKEETLEEDHPGVVVAHENMEEKIETDHGKTDSPEAEQVKSKKISTSSSSSISPTESVSTTTSDDVEANPTRSVQSSKRPRGSKSATLDSKQRLALRKRETTGKLDVRSSSEEAARSRSGGLAVPKPEAGSSGSPKNLPVPAGASRLLTLCRRGEWSVVDQLIRAMEKGNEEINYADEETQQTTLMLAIKDNRLPVVERLLDIGADVNWKAKDGKTPLHYASLYGKDDMVKLLLNKKADPNVLGGPKHQLPLHMACSRIGPGMIHAVQSLTRASAKDSRVTADKDGLLPLQAAVEVGNLLACNELLTVHPEQQLKHKRSLYGDTAMHMASRRHDSELMKLFGDCHTDVNIQNDEGNTPLHISCIEGDEAGVQLLHKYKANANITNKMDRTPLHVATELGHTSIVEILIDKYRAGISGRTKDGSTLIHIAASHGHPETALAFLKKGVPLHMPNKSGASCLHAAAMTGHVQVIKALLNKGAQVDGRSKDNYTALHVAVQYCKPLAVQTLLGYGAQVDLKGGKIQETPLHIAASITGGEKCVEMLIKSGANVNITQENLETPLHIAARHGNLLVLRSLLEDGADHTALSKSGESPLHAAVRYCHYDVTAELLTSFSAKKSRFDTVMLVNQQNQEGETAVHYAAELTSSQIHYDGEDVQLIRLLLEYGGDINIRTKLTQETGLHYAARAGNKDVMKEIVTFLGPARAPSALNKQAKNGSSALQMASEQGHLDVVNILLTNNARVDVFDEQGKAALHLAAENGHDGVTDTLLKNRAYVGVKSKLGVTPLHLAAQNGHNKLVRLLVERHSAARNALTLAKQTPLHLAARNGQKTVVATLLKLNADATATDTQGQTPLHLAAENDHSDVVKMFLKYRPELVSMANTNGMTCAHIAASKGSTGVVQELMRFNLGVVLTAKNKTNESTTLHLAAAEGHAEVVRVLVDAGAQVEEENADGMTALHLAAKYGHVNVLEVLGNKVVWSSTSTKTGFTALHVAAQSGQTEFVHEMLTNVPATLVTVPPQNGQSNGTAVSDAENGYTALHLAALSGHEGLSRMLLNVSGIHPDARTAINGSIALHLAAQNGHTEVVSLLLNKSTATIRTKDFNSRTSLHLAASKGHIEIVSLLLGQGSDIDAYDKGGWTALHMASRSGHLDVVRLLVEAGANPRHETMALKVPISLSAEGNHTGVLSYLLDKDHDEHQLMDDSKFIFDLMVVGKMTKNKSVREFVLTSAAPAEVAAKLSKIFRSLALREKERAKDLLAAGNFCEEMATELTAIAAGVCHAGPLLNSVDSLGVTFLDILIDCQQKEVVAHPTVQLYLSEIWTGYLSAWPAWKLLLFFCVLLFVPPVWIIVCLPLKHRFFRLPVIKFMSHLVSHLYLIALLILCIVFPPVSIWDSANLIPHGYEWLLLAWLSGLLVSQLTDSEDRAGLGWLKVIVIGVAALGVFVHLLAFAFQGDQRLECIYVRNQFFAFALLLSFIQLMEFLSFHNLFGPWAIIIRELMKDLLRFLVVLSIFMLGFTFHLAAVYVPVTSPPDFHPDLGDGNGSGAATFRTPQGTFELLFFALFGLIDPENMPPLNSHPWWSMYLLKAILGVYMLITFIVLVNLLIAMMTDTYADIQAASDTEWKFGRAKLFRNMKKSSSTPTPMNLLAKVVTYLKILAKYRGGSCKVNIQHLVDEAEDVDVESQMALKDIRKMSLTTTAPAATAKASALDPDAGSTGYPPGVGGPGVAQSTTMTGGGLVRIEKIVDWSDVTDKYLAFEGLDNDRDHKSSTTTNQ